MILKLRNNKVSFTHIKG